MLRAALVPSLPRAEEIALNTPVLMFSLIMSVLTAAIFGALPALISSRNDVTEALREGGRGTAGAQQGAARRVLVVAEMALATVLLTGAALLVQSFVSLQHVNLGFDASQLTAGQMGLPESRYSTNAAYHQFYNRLLADIKAVPGKTGSGQRIRDAIRHGIGLLQLTELHLRREHKTEPGAGQGEKCSEENERAVVHTLAPPISAVAAAYAAVARAK